MTQRELQVNKQEDKEGLGNFLTRWRTKDTQVVNRPLEKEQVTIFIKNLTSTYCDHLQF